ncbi:hypothetical protein [Nisaea sediminum]|uniref:hypothetical protein n=1 Tax=Nisaea sediminum TaxID=2775867 RepID=UPI001868DFDD|nr:hypothetical protein [Nisaea sediminum]
MIFPIRLLTAFALCLSLSLASQNARSDSTDLVVLTVSGLVSKPNRGPSEPFGDAFLNALEERFEKARSFTWGELEALPQVELELRYPNWPRAVRFRGPALEAVLESAGAGGSSVLVQALDGYAPGFERAAVRKAGMVLALEADGKPIPLGGRGPLWLVFEPGALDGGKAVEDDAGLVWAVFHIKVTNGE